MKVNFFRNIFALFIIFLGGALVLVNIGVVDWGFRVAWNFLYPSFFVLLGLKWTIQAFKGETGYGSGLFLLLFGSLLLLDRFGYVTFAFWDVYKLWPLFLVCFGLQFLGSPKKKFKVTFESDKESDWKSGIKGFTIGDHKYDTPNWKAEPIKLWNAVGDHYIDFTKAFIPDEDIPVFVHGLAGDINILMPEHVEFSVNASVKAGEIVVVNQTADGINRSLTFETPGYQEATRKITLDLKLKAGSIRVNKV
ncbi:lia operon protein LiaF [Natronobacillus azotifigens]|uniref:Cell wall-active antibiotics response protein LiaF n=1 Tax=Natronobacillus azotifigens TaxID=472978 RepID=A0A9J6RCR6_9BACI|nr:cell wall-active antibiotics response protein LiaF [Natronobacillus azotifigens]MCZ0703301.1 cell wall-active antibiotics response protein LiaF [Natronobacillus azotifigens]